MKESIKLEDLFEKTEDSLIGKGGFSEVLKVRYKKDNNIYALKILNYSIKDSEAQQKIKDFENEVSFLKRLRHNSIVRYIDDFVVDNSPAILMELVEGKSLDKLLSEEQYFNAVDVIEVAKQISAALMMCHYFQVGEEMGLISDTKIFGEHAIVHNDIHTKNIIQVENQKGEIQYKLIDFGLSFVNPNSVRTSMKINGMKEFKSPEKWEEKTLDTRSDIYSFGVVLYVLLTGQAPFPCDDYNSPSKEIQLMNSCLKEPVPEIWPLRQAKMRTVHPVVHSQPDFPYWLNNLVLKCLEKDPENRFRSGKELNEEIHKGIKGELEEDWSIGSPVVPIKIEEEVEDEVKEPQKEEILNSPTGITPSGNITKVIEKEETIVDKKEEPIEPSPPIPSRGERSNNKPFIFVALLVCILAVGVVWYFNNKAEANDKETTKTDSKEILKAYFQLEEKTFNEQEAKEWSQYFSFPVYYYTKEYTEQEFIRHYTEKMAKYEQKEIRIDSIVPVPNTEATLYRVYGEQRKFRKNSNAYNLGKIREEITLKEGKVIRIEKIEK